MAETLHPNAVVGTDIGATTSAVASDDGTYVQASAEGYAHYGFPSTASPDLVTGASSQSFTVIGRKDASGGNNVTIEVSLYQNGVLVASLGTADFTGVTDQTHTFTWDGTSYTGADNGADVEVYIAQTAGGSGNPSNRRYMWLDEVYWTADSFSAPQYITGAGGIDLKTTGGISVANGTLEATHDAESGDLTGVNVETGTPTADSTQAKTGTYSYLCEGDPTTRDEFSVPAPDYGFPSPPWASQATVYDFWAYWNNGIPSTSGWLWFTDGNAVNQWYLRAEGSSGATGQFHLYDNTNSLKATFDVNLSSGAWYRFKIACYKGDSVPWYMEIYDATDTLIYEFSASGLDTASAFESSWKLRFMGAGGTGTNVWHDDIKVYKDGEYFKSVPFGEPTVSASATPTISPTGIASTLAFGSARLNQVIAASSYSASASFGLPSAGHVVTATGYAATTAFGLPVAKDIQTISADGIASSLAFGTPQLNLGVIALPVSMGATAMGTPSLSQQVSVQGISNPPLMGDVNLVLQIAAQGYQSVTAFGVPEVSLDLEQVFPEGIGSSVAFGAPSLQLTIRPTGIAGGAQFGTPRTIITVSPSGFSEASVVGDHGVSMYISAQGIPSGVSFGVADLLYTVEAQGIASTVAFGNPVVAQGGLVEPQGFSVPITMGVPSLTGGFRFIGLGDVTQDVTYPVVLRKQGRRGG